MRLYLWHSKALKDAYDGRIVVMAESVEEARKKVRDDLAKYKTRDVDAYEKDMAVEPEVEESGVYFETGSA